MHSPIDYPALPCPAGTRKGCNQAFLDMQATVSSTSTGFLGGSLASFLVIAGLAAVLGFSGGEGSKPKDEESNNSSSSAIKKEELKSDSPI